MDVLEIFANPVNEVVLENTLDYLMQQIGGDQFRYVSPREVRSVWLIGLSIALLNGIGYLP